MIARASSPWHWSDPITVQNMHMPRLLQLIRLTLVTIALPLLGGCAGLYFRDAGAPPTAPEYALTNLPFDEYWTAIVFNGEKIGFTHFKIESAGEGEFLIQSTAALNFHFLTVDKVVKLFSEDRVGPDLTLRKFRYDYNLDGNALALEGAVDDGHLDVTITTRAGTERQRIALDNGVFPASVINLYPVLNGLAPGLRYEFPVYDGESQRLARVTQEITGYETSDLFTGPAYKLRTRLHGNEVTTWINTRGEPVLEISMGGIFIAGLESGDWAERSLALAALNKNSSLLDFSKVAGDRPISAPRQTKLLEIALRGLDGYPLPAEPPRQICRVDGAETVCVIRSGAGPVPAGNGTPDAYLKPSIPIPAGHPALARLARKIAGTAADPIGQIQSLLRWMQDNLKREAVDVFTALDVLEQKKAECQGHSYLYAGLARSLGIPTRLANGLVYSREHGGFLYHAWAESWVDGGWIAVDPTFGQLEADATHIKIIEGENIADLAPLLPLIGRLSARIISADAAGIDEPSRAAD
jgi:hypothetical protein